MSGPTPYKRLVAICMRSHHWHHLLWRSQAGCLALMLSACALQQFQEPASGARARLRVVSVGQKADTNVFVHPDASGTCIPRTAGGRQSIALLDWDNWHKGKQGVSVGIPGGGAYAPERFAEAFVPAGRPLTIAFGASVGTLNTANASCRIGFLLEPENGVDYEASFSFGKMCTVNLATVTRSQDGSVTKTPITVKQLQVCEK